MQPDEIRGLIESGIPGCRVEVEGDGTHFAARVVSNVFTDKNLLQRHRVVYQALGERMGTAIHALSIQAYTPDEWEKKRAPGITG